MKTKRNINMKRILIILLWVVVLSGLTTLVAFALKKRNERTCQGVEVKIISKTNRQIVEQKDVMSIVSKNFGREPVGKLIRDVNLKTLQEDILKNIWIADAKVYFDNNGILKVELTEKSPQARVFDANGNSYYVDETYHLLPFIPIQNLILPVFTNYPTRLNPLSYDSKKLLASIVLIGNQIKKDPFLTALIEQTDIDQYLEFTMIPKIGDQIISFGDSSNCSGKFEKLKLFYEKIIPVKGWNKYSKVSLQYRNQIVTTLRGMSEPVVDSMETLRVMNIIAEKASRLSGDIKKFNAIDPEIPTDPRVVDQSAEHDPSNENSVNIDMLSRNQMNNWKNTQKNSATPSPVKSEKISKTQASKKKKP